MASAAAKSKASSGSPCPQPPAGASRVVRFRTDFDNTIYDVLKGRGWEDVGPQGADDWDFFWADKLWIRESLPKLTLTEGQRINHFPNFWELTRKDNLAKNLKKMKRQLEREGKLDEAARYGFFPLTYNLPADYPIFLEEFKKNPPGCIWIMKPIAKSQGKGIFLFNKLSQIADWKPQPTKDKDGGSPSPEQYVVQRYIHNPYLVGGKKFDCRIYCLCLSYQPLVCYLYRCGFARFSHHRYSLDTRDIGNSFIHLTNVAVQKHSEQYDPDSGCKWDLRALKLQMVRKHGTEKVDKAFLDIQQAIIRALLAVQHVMVADRHCFELYGYDVLLDEGLHPYILEVNSSPSMSAENPADYHLKSVLLNDTLDMADMEGKGTKPRLADGSYVMNSGGFDLIYNNGWWKPFSCLGWYTPGIHGPRETSDLTSGGTALQWNVVSAKISR